MKITRILNALLTLFTVLSFSACTKTVTQAVNQVYSATYTIKPTDWALDNSGLFYYKVDLSVPEIDNLVVQDGGVEVYLSFDGGTTFDAIPETISGITYNALHQAGTLTIGYYTESNIATPPPLPNGSVLAKVIILDGKPL
ncbi:hypothetical protein [Puia dinghuensis]|uniref:Lipoprotein n=1 Tax=Puia dinghuensis TaxID=1792502 RepID=A0A8J2UHQ5_9BACT|nr:hypothetical protein [Puia dinghuensis]GGB18780.1 hypothetical protein GCM10011511_48230 [Puia dinghuensis]